MIPQETSDIFCQEYVGNFTEWQDWVRRDKFGYWVWFRADSGNYLALFRDEAHYISWDVDERPADVEPLAEWYHVSSLREAETIFRTHETAEENK